MGKINFMLSKNNQTIIKQEKQPAKIIQNEISFELDATMNIIRYDSKILKFIRENKEFRMELTLMPVKNCIYTLKEKNYIVNITVENSKVDIQNKIIEFSYKLETTEEENKIKIEILEE